MRLVIIGSPQVGKTKLVAELKGDQYIDQATVSPNVSIVLMPDNPLLRLELVDTPGVNSAD